MKNKNRLYLQYKQTLQLSLIRPLLLALLFFTSAFSIIYDGLISQHIRGLYLQQNLIRQSNFMMDFEDFNWSLTQHQSILEQIYKADKKDVQSTLQIGLKVIQEIGMPSQFYMRINNVFKSQTQIDFDNVQQTDSAMFSILVNSTGKKLSTCLFSDNTQFCIQTSIKSKFQKWQWFAVSQNQNWTSLAIKVKQRLDQFNLGSVDYTQNTLESLFEKLKILSKNSESGQIILSLNSDILLKSPSSLQFNFAAFYSRFLTQDVSFNRPFIKNQNRRLLIAFPQLTQHLALLQRAKEQRFKIVILVILFILCNILTLVGITLVDSFYFLSLLTFLKNYDLILKKAAQSEKFTFIDIYKFSIQFYSKTEQKALCKQFKSLLSHLREFIWIMLAFPAQSFQDQAFMSSKLQNSFLQNGIKLFKAKSDPRPYFQIVDFLVHSYQKKGDYMTAISLLKGCQERQQRQISQLQIKYNEDNPKHIQLFALYLFGLYKNLIKQIEFMMLYENQQDLRKKIQPIFEVKLSELQTKYNVLPEMQLQTLILKLKAWTLMGMPQIQFQTLYHQSLKFFNKMVSKPKARQSYLQIANHHRLKQNLDLIQINCFLKQYSISSTYQNKCKLIRRIDDYFAGNEGFQGPGLVAIRHKSQKFFDPLIRGELIEILSNIVQDRKLRLCQSLRAYYSVNKSIILMIDCTCFKDQNTLKIIIRVIGRMMLQNDQLQIYFFGDSYSLFLEGSKDKISSVSVTQIIQEMESFTCYLNKESKLVECFSKLVRQKDFNQKQKNLSSVYFIFFIHDLHLGGEEHFNQISRRTRDRYLDLSMLVKNNFIHVMVASSERKSRQDSYKPEILGFQSWDFHFLNGENDIQIEREVEDYLN